MDASEISKILNDWASALKIDEEGRKRSYSIRDLIKKYSQDVVAPEGVTNSKRSVRPWSREDFTSRLLTFHHSATWFAKQDAISPLRCASHGWCNDGIDQLHCWSCDAKLVHSKGDNDGSDLLQLLRSGHSSHCGWTNNFCSEEFLTFPARSSAKFIEEFLLRVRAILLSITEFARDACETAADQQIIEDIRSSPSNKDTESCSTLVDTLTSSRMQVLIGNDVLNSASELSDWLLKDLQSGNVVEFPLLPASSATCRSHIAATVESITALLTRCTGRGTTLTADDTSGILNAILSPNDRNGPTRELGMSCSVRSLSQDELTARKAVKMSVLLAVCGWNPVQSTVASADISSKAKATSTPTSSASAPVSAVTGSSLGSFQCEWCGRSFSFKYLLSSPADPLFQHRAHCLWAHSTRATGAESQAQVPPGWQQCASSVISSSNQQSESQDSLRGSTSRRESGSGGAESVPGSGTKRVASREPSCGDAEQAYKKIKSVIDSAALPRLSLNGRLSI